ncbi:MAG: hypothetical protein ABIM62_03395 [candidate division WOR-3 bacterium]
MNIFLMCMIIFQVNTKWTRRPFEHIISKGVKGVYKDGYIYAGGNQANSLYYPQSPSFLIVVKYDTAGNYIFSYNYDPSDYSRILLKDFAIDNTQDIYVAFAAFKNSSQYDYGVLKFDSSESYPVWIYIYNDSENKDDIPVSIKIGRDNKIYVAGYAYKDSIENYDFYIIKFLPCGGIAWSSFYGYTIGSADFARDMVIDKDGNIWICGETYDMNNVSSLVLLKYDTLGNILFSDIYNLPNASFYPKKIIFDQIENIYVIGNCLIDGNSDYLIAKYKVYGQREWVINYGESNNFPEIAYSCGVDTCGYIYVTGESAENIMTLKISPNSQILWSKRLDYSLVGKEIGYDISVEESGNSFITGIVSYDTFHCDFLTLKYTSSGVLSWTILYDAANFTDSSYSIFLDENKDIYVVGVSDTVTGDSLFIVVPTLIIIKYSEESNIKEVKRKNIFVNKNDLKGLSCDLYDILGRRITSKNLRLPSGIYYSKKKKIVFMNK